MALRCACGSADWIGCRPGTEAEVQDQGNLFVLKPEPEVPMQVWCAACWPWTRKAAA